MTHFVKIENNIVTQMIVAEPEFFDTFVDDSPGEWIQTSYNTLGNVHSEGGAPLRKNYAGIGHTYDKARNAFYADKPHNSWILNETTCIWEAPVMEPMDDKYYTWNEETTSWIEEGSA